VPAELLRNWKSYSPRTRNAVLDVLLRRDEWLKAVLDALEKKEIAASEMDAPFRQHLLDHRGAGVRSRVTKLFAGLINTDRQKVIDSYADVLKLQGDAAKELPIFTKNCAACHKLGDVGNVVGPDLVALANRTPAYLMQEILDPNKNVDSRYIEYQARLKDGRTVSGLLAAETATTIILRGQQHKEETLLRTDIEELRGSGKSLMPEGIEKDVSKKDMADLLAFLTSNRPPPKQFPGNTPAIVTPTAGRLTFRAESAEIYGGDIAFESDFKNIGIWHGTNDHVEWRVSLPKAGTFDVYLDYACDGGSAGNELVIEGSIPAIRWKVASTGAWSKYQTVKIGTVKLPAGEGRISVRPAGPLKGALIDLRAVIVVPPGETPGK
jgi:putative heme-binding domain-containing protein